MAIITLYALVTIGVLVTFHWLSVHGVCKRCANRRKVVCGCCETNSRKPWRNFGGKR